MRRCLIAVGLVGALACRPAPVIAPEDAGPRPTLELSSESIDAGQASLRFGQTAQREGVISIRTHDTAAPLALDVSVTGPLTTEAMLTLEPDVWTEVPVALAISRVGELRGVVSLTPRERGIAAVSATVFGVGTAAPDCILVEPATIDFGTLNQGCPVAHQPVRITNDCAVPRLLSGAEVAPLVEPFALSQLTSLPRRLQPGESWSGLVEFLGGGPGLHQALLRFDVDGALGAAVGLQGVRSDAGPREFSITIVSPQIDVLVVLDSSPSFVPRRAVTEQRVLRDLTDPQLFPGPLRAVVVPIGGSQFVDGSYFESWQPTFSSSLQQALANSPSDGGELGRCIETAAQISTGLSFWRRDSRRVAVCLTDAPEQSSDVAASMATLADAGVRWNVIGPPLFEPDGGCQVDAFDDGGHLMTTAALDGSVSSICGDWRLPGMEPTPMSARQYVLPFTPNFPITVVLDGVELSASEWFWDGPRRTLELVAAPLSSLVVRESLACPP